MIRAIEALVNEIKKENNIVNEIVRDDVFSILQEQCTVLYYPLEGEESEGCDGCHLQKMVNGEYEQFVFINTKNTRERQAFTAAHELGHIWKVDKRIKEMHPELYVSEEEIVNKFAAELLMPKRYFETVLNDRLEKIGYEGPNMDMITMVGLVAYLMNYFFAPYKSVVRRMNEIGRLNEASNDIIYKYKSSSLLKSIIKAEQYTRLGIVNELKSMDNLQEYIQIAEKEGLINSKKIQKIRADFDIEAIDATDMKKVKF